MPSCVICPLPKVRKGDRSRPLGEPALLSCFFLDCAVNLLPRVIVNFHVVIFATVLLELGHDLRFAISADLPITVFRANVRAANIQFSDCRAVRAQRLPCLSSCRHAFPHFVIAQYRDRLSNEQNCRGLHSSHEWKLRIAVEHSALHDRPKKD